MFKKQLFFLAFSLLASMPLQANTAQENIQQKMIPHDFVLTLKEEDLVPSIQNSSCLLLDVYADWCRPCKLLQPILADLSLAYKDKCIFAKIDGSKNQKTQNTLKVNAYPTLIFFKDGKEVARLVGLPSKDTIEKKINELFP